MKKLIVLVLVLGLVGAAHAYSEDFTYSDQVLDANGIGSWNDLTTTTAEIASGEFKLTEFTEWYIHESLDITTYPQQAAKWDIMMDPGSLGNQHWAGMVLRNGPSINSAHIVITQDGYSDFGGGANGGGRSEVDANLYYPSPNEWVTVELEMDWTAGTTRSRVSPRGGSLGNWSATVALNPSQYDRIFAYGGGGIHQMDNFSLTPEPATIALLGMGALALIRKRR